jgi:transcriptional regulator with XRE-family HTH domain
MGLGEQIKQRRTELQMTQTDLADKLHVSRSAVSNWEIGRNYPDMQIIVELSDLLNISLDTLLKGDTQMVAQISNDTKNVKRLHRKNTILLLIILLFLLFSILYLYKSHQYADITDPDQVVSVKLQKNNLVVTTDLPFYRSASDEYFMNTSASHDSEQISLTSKLDFSFKNKNTIVIPYKETYKSIDVLHGSHVIKHFSLKN